MSKKIMFLLAGVMLLCASCSPQKNVSYENVKFRIGLMPDVTGVPFVVGRDEGFFAANGINIEIVTFKSAQDRDFALSAGQLDATSSDIISLLLFNESGTKMTSIGRTDGRYGLATGTSGVKSYSDFSGGKIGLSFNTLMEYMLDMKIESGDIDLSKIEKTSVPALPLRLEMLNNGQIEAAMLPEPMASSVSETGSVLPLLDSESPKPSVLLVTAEYLAANDGICEKIEKAYNESAAYLNKGSADYSKCISELSLPENSDLSLFVPYNKLEKTDESEFLSVLEWVKQKDLVKGEYEYKNLVVR